MEIEDVLTPGMLGLLMWLLLRKKAQPAGWDQTADRELIEEVTSSIRYEL
mgnify:CR=1 FL=1